MKKRVLTILLACLLTLGLLPFSVSAAGELAFTDVVKTDWFYNDVKTAVDAGLVNGKSATTYCPADNLTYAEAVKLAACMNQKHTTGVVSLVNGDPWYQSYVDYAKMQGIITKDYEWKQPATRAGYMAIFAHALPDSALAAKNAAKALSLIPGILETLEQERGASGGRGELALISAASSEFKNLLSAKCEAERYSIPPRANADYFYNLFDSRKGAENNSSFFSLHPFRAFKLWENSARFTDEEISRAFGAIFSANKQMVTGGDMRLALENLVIKIAGA